MSLQVALRVGSCGPAICPLFGVDRKIIGGRRRRRGWPQSRRTI